jgi:alcohol dehydrogenase
VAIGGGSPIDCAKAIAVLATHSGNLRDFEMAENITGEVLPLIAIPTTAGTGSEVTFSSVITDTRNKFKFSIHHTGIASRIALLDPEVTLTLPPDYDGRHRNGRSDPRYRGIYCHRRRTSG